MKSLRSQNYYEILGISRYASPEEIRNAYELSKLTFTQNSLATYSLFSEEENEEILELISKAYETLLNPEVRREYDNFLDSGAQGSHHAWETRKPVGARQAAPSPQRPPPAREPAREPPARESPAREPVMREPFAKEPQREAARPKEPAAPESAPREAPRGEPGGAPTPSDVERFVSSVEHFSGDDLRRIREMRGMSIFEMCSKTKIRQTYVEYIESENFSGLPAPVYVRGFVKLMATALALPPEDVANDYMSRYRTDKRA